LPRTKRLSGSVVLTVALALGASSRRRGRMWARGRWPRGPGGGGELSHPLLVALLAGGGLGFQLGFGVLQPGQPLSPAGQRPRQLVSAGRAVLAVFRLICLGGLREQLSDLGLEVGVGPVGSRSGVGLDLGAVQGNQPQAEQPGHAHRLDTP